MHEDGIVTVSDTVLGKWEGHTIPRWAVMATFAGIGGAAPRCVDYRVRVIPTPPDDTEHRPSWWGVVAANQVIGQMENNVIEPAQVENLGDIPAEGIPRRVFEEASQARLLEKARAIAERRPDKVAETARAVLARPKRRPGRPPARSLPEKLRILADVEDAFAEGRSLSEIGKSHDMSRSSVRDLLSWARNDANPRLFVSPGPGRTGGGLTPVGRAMFARLPKED